MYLLTLYFDKKSTNTIKRLIERVSEVTHNQFMVENSVPPHLTLLAFETKNIEGIKDILLNTTIKAGGIQCVNTGCFKGYVLELSVVYNAYLYHIQKLLYDRIIQLEHTTISKYYQPFAYFPHITIAKKLQKEDCLKGLELLINEFSILELQIEKIGLSRVNPYMNILEIELGE